LIEKAIPPKCFVKKADLNEVMSEYPNDYKLISFEQLNEKILNGGDFIYAICDGKDLNIFSSISGELLCSDFNSFTVSDRYKKNFKWSGWQVKKNKKNYSGGGVNILFPLSILIKVSTIFRTKLLR
jgi:hypothetical protein